MASKLKYNVGTFKGLLGTAIVYLCETEGGTLFLVHKVQITEGATTVEKFQYTARSAMQTYMANGDGSLSSTVDISKLADAAPTGVLDAGGYAIIDNGGTVPRLYTSQALYSIKGDGIADYTGDKGTPVTGSNGQTVVINSTAKTMSETISDLTTWAGKNWYFVVGAIFLLGELLGWWNLLGLRKKKTRKRR